MVANILNALSVISVLLFRRLYEREDIKEHIATFAGVKRRFSARQIQDLTIIDDYAHHPSEITGPYLMQQNERYRNREIVAIFQPHTFSRTVAMLNEFAESLSLADKVYLVEIFNSAREANGK